jgi:hypothetical protein
MPTDSDRDSLARIIFTVTEYASWQTWEQTSDGLRDWCRAKADEAMAKGWRKVGADQVVVSRETAEIARRNTRLMRAGYQRPQPEETKWAGILPPTELDKAIDELEAALADPAGANGGE